MIEQNFVIADLENLEGAVNVWAQRGVTGPVPPNQKI
jgi:hypothetical protein